MEFRLKDEKNIMFRIRIGPSAWLSQEQKMSGALIRNQSLFSHRLIGPAEGRQVALVHQALIN